MNKFIQWVQMGDHGIYIWSAYAICFVVLSIYFIVCSKQKQNILKQLNNKK